jgi:hypothetical protein
VASTAILVSLIYATNLGFERSILSRFGIGILEGTTSIYLSSTASLPAFMLALGLLPERLRFVPSQMPFISPSRRGGHKLTMALPGLMVILRLEGLLPTSDFWIGLPALSLSPGHMEHRSCQGIARTENDDDEVTCIR